jgi:hypothetical protein
MAFELLGNLDTVHFDILQRRNSYAILGRVGRDEYRSSNYFVHVGLEPTAGMGGLEYYFALVEVDALSGQEIYYWSGIDVAPLIGATDRTAILAVVARATAALLDFVKPNQVHRCTRDAHMPDAALEKHNLISVVFDRCGYVVMKTDVYHGKHFWIMERQISAGSGGA